MNPRVESPHAIAVELELESGRPSAEHVLNVLAHLQEGRPPEQAEAALGMTEPPTAAHARQDGLRTVAAQCDLRDTEVNQG